MSDIEKELQKPLDASKVKTRQQAGQTLSYIEAWHVIAEANRIFGHLGWNRETIKIDCVSEEKNERGNHVVGYIAKVKITVGSVVREGTGAGSGISKSLADAHEGASKEAESDAMKRAFMTFGNPFGLALYDKEKTNVEQPIPDKILNGVKKILEDIPKIHDIIQITETLEGKQYQYIKSNYPQLLVDIDNALQQKQNELNGVKSNG
jgi:DNA recombination protein Rad52